MLLQSHVLKIGYLHSQFAIALIGEVLSHFHLVERSLVKVSIANGEDAARITTSMTIVAASQNSSVRIIFM